MTQLHIGFDVSQKPRGRIDSNYQNIKKLLEGLGFGCWEFASFPITRHSLQNYDILVFPCTDFSKFTQEEINAISQWVNEDGGGLLLLSHAGGDRGRRTNMSELAAQFGIIFENDQVRDENHNFGIDNMPEIKNFPIPHPITEGIGSICYRAGCSLTVVGIATQVAMADLDAEPQSATVIAASEPGEGRVVSIGSYEIFRDDISGGINHPYHSELAKNIFNWLSTDKRKKMREGGLALQPDLSSNYSSETYNSSSETPEKDFTGKLVEINSVHDLFMEIKNILNDLELLKARVLNIYNVASLMDKMEEKETIISQKESGEALHREKISEQETTPEKSKPTSESSAHDDLLSLIAAKKKKPETKKVETKKESPSIGDLLSELKSEQKDRSERNNQKSFDDLKISQPGLGTVAPDDNPEDNEIEKKEEKEIKYEITTADKMKSKDELDDEIDKLKAKLKSVQNLLDFTERKFMDGKIDEEQYKKDMAKFDKDIRLTKSKIEAYTSLLESL
ncbi:MAG: hypothetical protein ACTSVI_07155 [Promethearchaeota archaeon]